MSLEHAVSQFLKIGVLLSTSGGDVVRQWPWRKSVDCKAPKELPFVTILICEGRSTAMELASNHGGGAEGQRGSCATHQVDIRTWLRCANFSMHQDPLGVKQTPWVSPSKLSSAGLASRVMSSPAVLMQVTPKLHCWDR